MPDLYHKDYSEIYELVGKLSVEIEYDIQNYEAKEYLFKPFYTAGWRMKDNVERQFASEISKSKPTQTLTIKQLTKKAKRWKIF